MAHLKWILSFLIIGAASIGAASIGAAEPSAKPKVPSSQSIGEAIQFPVEKYALPNGLTALLVEDHTAPFFSFQTWFRVGSRDEKPGRTGLAHFFEHYMFRGTKKYPYPQFDKMLTGNGGKFNAFTSQDYTGYYVNLPAGKLELAMDLESDRMRNLVFNQDIVNKEREVVKEERRMRTDNDVFGTIWEKTWRTLFKTHPYGWPVIGTMGDLNQATLQDLSDFYKVHYAPNNAIIVLAGDFSKEKAKKLIEQYYGSIPRQNVPVTLLAAEPPPSGERQVRIRRDVQNPSVGVAYPGPKYGDPDVFAMDLIGVILGHGPSSRLYKKMVYQTQMATEVSVDSVTKKDAGILVTFASLKPSVNVDAFLQLLSGEFYKLRSTLVPSAELDKAKSILMTEMVDGMKTIYGKAQSLAIHEVLGGDYLALFKELEDYQAVTAEQIQNVAKKYLTPQQRVVIRVEKEAQERRNANAAAKPETTAAPPTEATGG